MVAKPILFGAPMIRAILDGSKVQTRRVLKQAVGPSLSVGYEDGAAELSWLHGDGPGHDVHETIKRVPCPYGNIGDLLWVREAWRIGSRHDATPPRDLPPRSMTVAFEAGGSIANQASGKWECGEFPLVAITGKWPWLGRLRPGMFMPRWASRITLEIVDVRVERLNSISEDDAIAEGIERDVDPGDHCILWRNYLTGGTTIQPQYSYETLWDSINGRGAWETNPFVWAVSFKRVPQ